MTVVSITQDTRGGGGNATVVAWYRRWVAEHEPNAVECYLDETTTGWPLRARREWGPGLIAIPRALPRLHIPPYLAGRAHLRDMWDGVEAVHVVGAVSLHGWLADPDVPMVVWFATTIEDERRSAIGLMDRRRRSLYRATLPGLNRIETSVLQRAQRVLAMSPHTADLLIRKGVPSRRVDVRPVPIDPACFDVPPRNDRHGLLFVGRAHDPRKGLDRAVELLARSAAARNVGLDIVSEHAPPAKLLRHANGAVRWHGALAEVANAYQRAQLLLMPSRQEGLGIVAFEALASGTPVVAYRCGGADAYLAESGGAELVDNGPEFRSVVERLLIDERARDEMGARGRAWVQQHLSAESFLGDPAVFRP